MSKGIPENYPNGCSNEELIDKIKEYQYRVKQLASSEYSVLGSSYWKDISDLGQNELIRRILEKQVQENRNAKTINYWLNGITIILALITSFVGYQTHQFAQSDLKSDEIWMKRQIDNLKENNTQLLKINENLETLIATQKPDSTSN